MFSIATQLFLLLFAAFLFRVSLCECRQTYITICDSFKDLETYKDSQNIVELMIGSDRDDGKPTSTVHLLKVLQSRNLRKMKTLIISKAIHEFETKYAFRCGYFRTSLETLIIYGNTFESIGAFHLPTIPLRRLSLVNNKIQSIEKSAFWEHDVENIDLSENLLEEIVVEALPQSNVTKTITIKNNKLIHIEPKSFPQSLRVLNLDGNKLRTFENEVLDLPNLQEFTMSNNKFKVIPEISHLKELLIFDISHNLIKTVENGTFKDLEKLKFLDLSNNNIDQLSILTLHIPGKQPNLTISLAFNKLTDLYHMKEVDLEKKMLVMYGNPWGCREWTSLKTKLIGHESQCDLEFSSTGKVPYCFDYNSRDYFLNNKWQGELERFQTTVRKSANSSMCDLKLDRNRWLHPMDYRCTLFSYSAERYSD